MRIAIVGAGGRLGTALAREYSPGFDVRAFRHADLALEYPDQIHKLLRPLDFDLLINAAALTNVDYCESHREEAIAINAEAPRVLAEICDQKRAKLIHISTDYVFDGKKRQPYSEEDDAVPLSVYGESKRQGEVSVIGTSNRHLVVRVSWVFGPDRPSFVDQVIQRARGTADLAAISDKFATPTYTLDLAGWLQTAWQNDLDGLLHLANAGECSWQEFAQYAIDCCAWHGIALRGRKVRPLCLSEMKNFVAERPVYSVLSTRKFAAETGTQTRHWREAVAEYIERHLATK